MRRIDDLGRDFVIAHKADIDPDSPLEFVCAETERGDCFLSLADDFL